MIELFNHIRKLPLHLFGSTEQPRRFLSKGAHSGLRRLLATESHLEVIKMLFVLP